MFMSILKSIFGDANERYIRSLVPILQEINSYEQEFQQYSDEKLRELTEEFRRRIHKKDETFDDLLPEAFAAVREAATRTLGMRHFDVQLIGGIVLHQGKIAEMKTGEGKTLVATLPLYLNSLPGNGVHLVTPNDYLSRVGAGWMGPLYHILGIRVGVVTHDMSGLYDPSYEDRESHGDPRLAHFRPCTRREAYEADITYGTNNEFGFDYLRDNLEYTPEGLRQRGYEFAIVDEVDSILIDEARTPLIISMPDEESAELYPVFARLTPQLKEGVDYNIDEKLKAVSLTEAGIDKVEKILGIENIYAERGVRFVRYLESSLRAHALFSRDRDYVVKNGAVIIVDEFTGRLMPGRRWSEGLHQAIEAKEGVRIEKESRTLATITFQNYFRMYKKLSGMTGTAQTSAEEFHKVYNLEVITVPTHRPMVREDLADFIFRTERGKFQAVVAEIRERHKKGQPVLVGTVSIEKNERLSKMLEVEGIPHELLNAKNHEREALIIADAGRYGAVTVATNMAGRGVDIILGGSRDSRKEDGDRVPKKEREEVQAAGGLYVIGTERHEARRIDNQLRGRAGRQGDPGSSRFFVSLEDDLMRVFGSDKIKRMMESFGIPEDQPIENNLVSRALESAQGKIEGFHFDSRKHVLEFDNVLNKQRYMIYQMRKDFLFGVVLKPEIEKMISESTPEDTNVPLKTKILGIIDEEITRLVGVHTDALAVADWNLEEIFETMKTIAVLPDDVHTKLREIAAGDEDADEKRDRIKNYLISMMHEVYDAREQVMGIESMRNLERAVLLRSIDSLWMDHLDQMEHLRDSVRLRAYGQRDPLVEYKHEGTRLFRELLAAINTQVVNTIFKVSAPPQQEIQLRHAHESRPLIEDSLQLSGQGAVSESSRASESNIPVSRAKESVHRNDPCPCGSGKKYKKCHGA